MAILTYPTWKDNVVQLPTDANSIMFDDQGHNRLFTGMIYQSPETNKVNVSKIATDFVDTNIAPFSKTLSDYNNSFTNVTDSQHLLVTCNAANTEEQSLGEYLYKYDWSYDDNVALGSAQILNRPINGRITPSMWVYLTFWPGHGVFINLQINENLTLNDDSVKSTSYTKDTVASTVMYSTNIEYSVPQASSAKALDLSIENIGSLHYDVTNCGEYALYYVNRYGALDNFLIEGNVRKISNIYREGFTRGYVNKSNEKMINQESITTAWEMSTGWLTDEQSETLATHLLESPKVWISNLNDGTTIPVVLTDSTVEHKKFRNGHQLNRYDIKVESANKTYWK